MKEVRNHQLNHNTLMCSCGRPEEAHLQLDLDMDKIIEFRFLPNYSWKNEFEMVDKAVNKFNSTF